MGEGNREENIKDKETRKMVRNKTDKEEEWYSGRVFSYFPLQGNRTRRFWPC